jgi:hypothetical protein
MEVKNVPVFSLWKQFQFVPPITTQSAANATMLNLTSNHTRNHGLSFDTVNTSAKLVQLSLALETD